MNTLELPWNTPTSLLAPARDARSGRRRGGRCGRVREVSKRLVRALMHRRKTERVLRQLECSSRRRRRLRPPHLARAPRLALALVSHRYTAQVKQTRTTDNKVLVHYEGWSTRCVTPARAPLRRCPGSPRLASPRATCCVALSLLSLCVSVSLSPPDSPRPPGPAGGTSGWTPRS